jgi:hypothetical protein
MNVEECGRNQSWSTMWLYPPLSVSKIRDVAQYIRVKIVNYNVTYNLTDSMKMCLTKKLKPVT